MVRLSTLSSTTAFLLSASYLASAAPLASDQNLKAGVVPVTKRASTKSLSAADLHRRDVERIQRRNERTAALLKTRGAAKRSLPAAAALPAFDIAPYRRSSNAKRQSTGSYINSLTNNKDSVWYGGTDVGTPGQTITIDFDTGSSDLIVPTSDCKNCTAPFFDPTQSSTFNKLGAPFNTSFGDNSVADGVTASDVVTIGTLSFATQTFGLVDYASVGFDDPNSGLMGLAFPANAHSGATPWFINLAEAGSLASNLFAFYLTSGGADGSELCFGCTDSSKYTGNPEYFPIIPDATSGQQIYWTIACQGLTYNGNIVGSAMTTMIDSGTSLIQVPPSVADAFYSNISGAEKRDDGYYIPCDTSSVAPFGFMFSSSTVFSIDASKLIAGPEDNGKCPTAIGSSGSEDGQAIVGDTFMAVWYSIFDYGNKQVGFAKAV